MAEAITYRTNRKYNSFFLLFLVLFVSLFQACSNPETDYERVEKLQESTKQLLETAVDFDLVLQSCDNVINSIDEYLKEHPDAEWNNIARVALDSWKAKKATYEAEFNSLYQELGDALQQKAKEKAIAHHSLSHFENFQLERREKSKQGSDLSFHDIYDVRMRGALVGKNVFKFKVHVYGTISMDNKKIAVNETVTIEE